MPPRQSLTSSFSVQDVNNEVVCPLRNQDATPCRKRCLGEKRYRSMQEHIRRAHPEYYLPKLPATKESFELMINTPPHEPPAIDPNHANQNRSHNAQQHQRHASQQHAQPQPHHVQHSDPSGLSPAFGLDHGLSSSFEGYHAFGQHDGGYYTAGDAEAAVIYQSMHAPPRDEYRRGSLIPAASAAAALAQLHYHRPDSDWAGDNMGQNFYADQSHDLKPHHPFSVDPTLEDHEHGFLGDPHPTFPVSSSPDQPSLMPSSIARSPTDRPATLPPLQRSLPRQHNRPRKSSLSAQARMSKHERKRSKELARRHSGGGRMPESSAAVSFGKRWEDLIDAAASATEEEDSRDLTPIPASPFQSPQVPSRTSLPPFALGSQFQSYQASPLNRALTPPPPDSGLDLQPFPSVESSLSSNISHAHHNSTASTGSQFHIMDPNSLTSPSESSPLFNPAHPAATALTPAQQQVQQQQQQQQQQSQPAGPVQIYCAGCRKLSALKDSYACTSCICGVCLECAQAITDGQSRGRMSMCPRCNAMDSAFRQFQLDFR